jgi:hypothetical protein
MRPTLQFLAHLKSRSIDIVQQENDRRPVRRRRSDKVF